MRTRLLAGLVGAVVALALFAPVASAVATSKVYAQWTFTVRGSVNHQWTVSDSGTCQWAGSGALQLHFRSTSPSKIIIMRSPYNRRLIDYGYSNPFGVRFRGTQTDGRVRNPPPPDDEYRCDAGEPKFPSGCPPFDDTYIVSVTSDFYKTPGHASVRSGINQFDSACSFGGFLSLTNGPDHPIRISYPTIGQLTHARGPLTFAADDTLHASSADLGAVWTATTHRHLVMTFIRKS